jgi:hypothetical protein
VTRLQLRSASEVEVQVETPEGAATLLPSRSQPEEIELPRTTPPYDGAVLFAASAIRRPDGSIVLRCDACVGAATLLAIPADGTLSSKVPAPSRGPPPLVLDSERVTVTEQTLTIHVDYDYREVRPRSSVYAPAFKFDLVTPTSNVVDFRKDFPPKPVPHHGLVALKIGAGLLLSAGTVFGVYEQFNLLPAAVGLSTLERTVPRALLGLLLAIDGIMDLVPDPGWTEVLWPRKSDP